MMEMIISCENLMKIYKTSDIEVIALQGLDLRVKRGEMIAIIGSSGSGKSTLLNILGGLVEPSAGKIVVDGIDLSKISDKDNYKYKSEIVGFIWQNSEKNLIPYLTVIENIEMVMKLRGNHDKEKAEQLLQSVGLINKKNSRLKQLSGGEQQRVAIAIGISSNPKILLADEPTGSVDSATAFDIMNLFRRLQKEYGLTIIIVTHDNKLAAKVDRVVLIRDGRTSSEYIKKEGQNDYLDVDNDFDFEVTNESHDEYAVLDNVGRLQIPPDLMERAGLNGKDRVKLAFEDGNIIIQNCHKK